MQSINQNQRYFPASSSPLEISTVLKHEMKRNRVKPPCPYCNDVCHGIMRPRVPEPALLSTADTELLRLGVSGVTDQYVMMCSDEAIMEP